MIGNYKYELFVGLSKSTVNTAIKVNERSINILPTEQI